MKMHSLYSVAIALALVFVLCVSSVAVIKMLSDDEGGGYATESARPPRDWNGSFIMNTEHKDNTEGRTEVRSAQDLAEMIINDPGLTGEYIQMADISFEGHDSNGGFIVTVLIDRSVSDKISFTFMDGSAPIADRIYVWLGEELKDTVTGTVTFDLVNEDAQKTMGAGGWMVSKGTGEYMAVSVDISDVSVTSVNKLSNGNFAPIGAPGAPFTGKYDGNGYTITGLETSAFSDVSGIIHCGLFNTVKNAELKNIGLEGGSSTALSSLTAWGSEVRVGSLVGRISGAYSSSTISCEILNCYGTGDVLGCGAFVMAGGITGQTDGFGGITASYCYNEGNVTVLNHGTNNAAYAGGLFGWIGARHTYCVYNTGDVTMASKGTNLCVGGVGGNSYEMLSHGYNTGNIFVYSSSSPYIRAGGLMGDISEAYYLYNTGDVSIVCNLDRSATYSSANAGGIAGTGQILMNCYNLGETGITDTTGSTLLNAGGIAGSMLYGSYLLYSYALENTVFLNGTPSDTICALLKPNIVDQGYTGPKGSGMRTLDQLKDKSMYFSADDGTYGWDFMLWDMIAPANNGLPFIVDLVPIVVKNDPEDCSVDSGTDAVFSLNAAHRNHTYYQWQINRGSGWEDVGTDSTYTHSTLPSDDGTSVRCMIYNEYGGVISREALLTVTEAPGIPDTSVALRLDDSPWDGQTVQLYQDGSVVETMVYDEGDYIANVAEGTYGIHVNGLDTGLTVSVDSSGGTASVDYYTASAVISNGGSSSVSPATSIVLTGGGTAFTVMPESAYRIKSVSAENADASFSSNTVTVSNVSGTSTVTIEMTNPKSAVVTVTLDGSPRTGLAVQLYRGGSLAANLAEGGTTGVYRGSVPSGTYQIYIGGTDTGATLTFVADGGGSRTLNYYTVTFYAIDGGTASGSTVTSSIESGTPVLSGTTLVFTASAAGTSDDESDYTYLWSDHTTERTTSATITSIATVTCTVTENKDGLPSEDSSFGEWWIGLIIGALLLILMIVLLRRRGYKVTFPDGIDGKHRARRGSRYVFEAAEGTVTYSNDNGETWRSPVSENGRYVIPEEEIVSDIEIRISR